MFIIHTKPKKKGGREGREIEKNLHPFQGVVS